MASMPQLPDDIPDEFLCPITGEIMLDPVMIASGHSFARSAIEQWFAKGGNLCPCTGEKLQNLSLFPNFTLRKAIQGWCEKCNVNMAELEQAQIAQGSASGGRTKAAPNVTNVFQASSPSPAAASSSAAVGGSSPDRLPQKVPQGSSSDSGSCSQVPLPAPPGREQVTPEGWQHLIDSLAQNLHSLEGRVSVSVQSIAIKSVQQLKDNGHLKNILDVVRLNQTPRNTASPPNPKEEAATKRTCTPLHTLSISDCNLQDRGAAQLADALKPISDGMWVWSNTLHTLALPGNYLGDEGMKVLMAGLKPLQNVCGEWVCTTNHIKHLNLDNNGIGDTGIELLVEAFLQVHTNNDGFEIRNNCLESLSLASNSIYERGARALGGALSPGSSGYQGSLKVLNLSENYIGVDGSKHIAAALCPRESDGVYNGVLEELNLANNHVGTEGVNALAEALTPREVGEGQFRRWARNTSLTSLDLAVNHIEDITGLAEALKVTDHGTCSISKLNLYDNKLGVDGMAVLSEALVPTSEGVFNKTLKYLNVGFNSLGPEGAASISRALQPNEHGFYNTALVELDLSINHILAEGAQSIATALEWQSTSRGQMCNSTLTALDLQKNEICTSGAAALGAALHYNKIGGSALRSLGLAANRVEDKGCEAVASAITPGRAGIYNTSLTSLDLSDNGIGSCGAEVLAAALQADASSGVKNTNLTSLNLNQNAIGDSAAKHIKNAMVETTEPKKKSLFSKFTSAFTSSSQADEVISLLFERPRRS